MSQTKKENQDENGSPFTGAKTGAVTVHNAPNFRDELGRFMEGNDGGPKRFVDRDGLVGAVLSYLDKCNASKKNPTMTGLALSLGFRSRRSLLNYEKEPGYEFAFDIIAYAKMKIEEYLEERLLDSKNTNIAGLIFNLKNNFDWQDKQDIRFEQRKMDIKGFELIMPVDE